MKQSYLDERTSGKPYFFALLCATALACGTGPSPVDPDPNGGRDAAPDNIDPAGDSGPVTDGGAAPTDSAAPDAIADATPDAGGRAVTTLAASNPDPYDSFGAAVAVSGDAEWVAVGAPGESSGAIGIGGFEGDNGSKGSGAVYIYRRSAGVYQQVAYQPVEELWPKYFGAPLL
jgi:hypothetical protein